MTSMIPEAATAYIDKFNELYQRGHPVLLIGDTGEIQATSIKSKAEIRDGKPVIFLNDVLGFYLLERVIPMPLVSVRFACGHVVPFPAGSMYANAERFPLDDQGNRTTMYVCDHCEWNEGEGDA